MAEFEELRSGIPDEDTDAVQEERLAVRDEIMGDICSSLQKMHGKKYSYDEVRMAVDIVSNGLKETLTSKKSIRETLQENQNKVKYIDKTIRQHQKHELWKIILFYWIPTL